MRIARRSTLSHIHRTGSRQTRRRPPGLSGRRTAAFVHMQHRPAATDFVTESLQLQAGYKIARLENGSRVPSPSFLKRIAEALDATFESTFRTLSSAIDTFSDNLANLVVSVDLCWEHGLEYRKTHSSSARPAHHR